MTGGKKIFLSYKYSDDSVENLFPGDNSTVRDYVDVFQRRLEMSDNIYKGEKDGEDLSYLTDEQIWEKLKNRIYDSSVTAVFISPEMREDRDLERNQWIPWEISYSLKEVARKNSSGQTVISKSNAMIAVVLPDQKGSYSYFLEQRDCCATRCITHHREQLFEIIKNNMFNIKCPQIDICGGGESLWHGSCSYIEPVKWQDFISNYRRYIERACARQEDISSYKIQKEICI